MRITAEIPGKCYRVVSESGSTYHITYAGSGDGDPEYVALWKCDCPARGDCKHLKAFLKSEVRHYGDPDYPDAPESEDMASLPLVTQYFADCGNDGLAPHDEANLRAWLWFTCPAHRRDEIESAIRRDTRWAINS